jgi:hypothetical protein
MSEWRTSYGDLSERDREVIADAFDFTPELLADARTAIFQNIETALGDGIAVFLASRPLDAGYLETRVSELARRLAALALRGALDVLQEGRL